MLTLKPINRYPGSAFPRAADPSNPMIQIPNLRRLVACAMGCFAVSQATATITFTQNSSTQWTAGNGIVTLTVNPTTGGITSLYTLLNGVSTNWLDPNYPCTVGVPDSHAVALYNLHAYSNATATGPITCNYHTSAGYVDIWATKADIPGSDPLEIEDHWVLKDNDPGVHWYQVLRHRSGDGATSYGAATTNFFPSGNALSRSDGTALLYRKNIGPNDLITVTDTFPSTTYTANLESLNPGRKVQAECMDYSATGLGTYLSTPGLTRQFVTKYNYQTYEEFHVAHGFIGNARAFWWVVPSHETMNGGPTKQMLTANNIEHESSHLGGADVTFAAGEVATRWFGPFYLRLNAFDATKTTNDSLYNDAANSASACLDFYDWEGVMLSNGYRARANRASVTATIANPSGWSTSSNDNVVILSDNGTYFQESAQGYQYWGYADVNGNVTIPNVMPGKYRLTAFRRGQWGLYHVDNVTVGTSPVTLTGLTFQPRNFSPPAPIWYIAVPDRSAHEFMHGHDSAGHDIRDYNGRWNYWQDLAPNFGKFVYTVGTSGWYQMPFTHYGAFYPGLYAGVYGGSTSGTNGYDYITPQYVIDGAAAQGKTPAAFTPPPWEVHFKTTATQNAQGAYVLVSINLAACDTASLQLQLNGTHSRTLLWYPRLRSNPEVRSGVAGYNNYAVFQFSTSDLRPAGTDNVLTLYASRAIMYDALKMEISANSADPAVTRWPEYDWVHYDPLTDATVTQTAAAP